MEESLIMLGYLICPIIGLLCFAFLCDMLDKNVPKLKKNRYGK